jgi:hypothetical protein
VVGVSGGQGAQNALGGLAGEQRVTRFQRGAGQAQRGGQPLGLEGDGRLEVGHSQRRLAAGEKRLSQCLPYFRRLRAKRGGLRGHCAGRLCSPGLEVPVGGCQVIVGHGGGGAGGALHKLRRLDGVAQPVREVGGTRQYSG